MESKKKKFNWDDWELDALYDRLKQLRKGMDVRYPHVQEPDPEELESIEEEIEAREEAADGEVTTNG